MDDRNKTRVRAFAEAFAGALSASLAQVLGAPWQLEITDSQETPASDAQPPLQFRVKLEGGLRGECFVEFYEPQLSELLARLAGADAPQQTAAERGKALAAVLSAAAAKLKSSLSSQYGELAFKIDPISGLACGGMFVVPLVQTDRPARASVFLFFDGGLLEALSGGQETAHATRHQFQPANLRLVMDVELNVSLRFGQRQLPLREVLELTSGSVIELDRMVDDPVEMLLDGKVVARGEAVIVDGNYGLRVTEIPETIENHLLRG